MIYDSLKNIKFPFYRNLLLFLLSDTNVPKIDLGLMISVLMWKNVLPTLYFCLKLLRRPDGDGAHL